MKIPSSMKRICAAAVPFCMLLGVIGSLILINPAYDNRITRRVAVSKGQVDLSANRDGINEVQGEWRFWWKNFIDDPSRVPSDRFAVFPGAWNKAGLTERCGFASYALTVTGLDPARVYAFRTGQTLSASSVVINGRKIVSTGVPGISANTESPAWNSVLARFSPRPDGSADIVLQVSNFHDRYGGSNASVYIGDFFLMYRMHESQKLAEAFVFAVLVVMGLLFLLLYLSRRKDHPFLWFACICLITGFRTLCYDEFVLLDIVPSLSWSGFFRLGYLTFPLVMFFFVGFLRAFFPSLVKPLYFRIISVVFLLYSLTIVFAPEYVSAILLFSFQIAGLATVGYGLYVIVCACVQRKERAYWLLFGFSVAALSFVYDVLVSMWLVSGGSISHFGVTICLFSLALMVIERYSSSFDTAYQLSKQLQSVNQSLRRFVPAEALACMNDSISDVQLGDSIDLEMAVFSARIRSFASITERMPPEKVFTFLNEYLELAGPIIRSNNGFIAKYEGDGFLALFPDGAESAVRSAIKMQSAIAQRNRTNPGQRALAVGIGIDSGHLALGTVGDGSRLDGAVISNCISCAEKYEATTKQYQSSILINESVYSGLSDPLAYFLRPVDRIDIGGKKSFLFEVYSNDSDTIRKMKWATQGDLEHALYTEPRN